jgi:signal transduction histidine kinase/PAS domain-containing protein
VRQGVCTAAKVLEKASSFIASVGSPREEVSSLLARIGPRLACDYALAASTQSRLWAGDPPLEWARVGVPELDEDSLSRLLIWGIRTATEIPKFGEVISDSDKQLSCVFARSIVFKQKFGEVGEYVFILIRSTNSESFSSASFNELKSLLKRQDLSNPSISQAVDYSSVLTFVANSDGALTYVSRRSIDFFGADPLQMTNGLTLKWYELLPPYERGLVIGRLQTESVPTVDFSGTVKVLNQVTGRDRELQFDAQPYFEGSRFLGWIGSIVDVSPFKAQLSGLLIDVERKNSLIAISNLLSQSVAKEHAVDRVLKMLADQLSADAAICFYSPRDNSEHEILAQLNLDQLKNKQHVVNAIRNVSPLGEAIVIPDMEADARSGYLSDYLNGYRSVIIVPIRSEDDVIGAVALMSKRYEAFSAESVPYVGAVCGQLGLMFNRLAAVREFGTRISTVRSLYRISHELLQLGDLEEIFSRAFVIMNEELGLRRAWLGLVGESGVSLTGQAAYGPGWKRRLVQMRLPIDNPGELMRRVLFDHEAVVVGNLAEEINIPVLRRFLGRFGVDTMVLTPLVSKGRLIGVLAIEPNYTRDDSKHVELYRAISTELANVISAKRGERLAAEAEKMQAAGLLAAGVAHNFNNTLQAIMGYASLIELQNPDNPGTVKAARSIVESVQRGASMIKQLSNFANLDEPLPIRMEINRTVRAELNNFQRSLMKGQKLIYTPCAEPVNAVFDESHLFKILQTLVENAADALGPGRGQIEVTVQKSSPSEDMTSIGLAGGGYVLVTVTDDGPGMDEETRKRCFEPFFTTKNVDARSGLGLTGGGLGLSEAYMLAKRNGGKITVQSKPAAGASFTVFLPMSGKSS